MSGPRRIQRKRAKGWRLPEGAVIVTRPTIFGNPFVPDNDDGRGYVRGRWEHTVSKAGTAFTAPTRWTEADVVALYRAWLLNEPPPWPYGFTPGGLPRGEADPCAAYKVMIARPPTPLELAGLRGRDLACWCALDQPCHADVLLEVTNA